MRLLATLDGIEREFEVEGLGADSYRLTLDKEEFRLDLRRVGSSSYSILVDGRSFDFDVSKDGDEMVVASRAGVTRLTIIDQARRMVRTGAAARGHRQGRAELRAMMPGRVVSVLVKRGDEVAAGQGVMIVEAMKMENELKAPRAGKVIEVKVEPGKTVEKNDLLVIIE